MPHFYTYQTPNPSAVNTQGSTGYWENPADWPRTYLYVSNQGGLQGIHPPAPVYQSNQPSQPAMYYFQGSSSAPAGYYVNGLYYGMSPPSASTGWPYTSSAYTCYTLPATSTPTTPFYPYNYSPYYTAPSPLQFPMTSPWSQPPGPAQAAAAVAANAALAAMPNAPAYFVGATAAEIQAQNAILLANLQAAQQQPSQLAPYKPGASPQFWCKELDGSWTLREYNDALKGDFPAGHWEKHATSGYFYYVRHTG
ncbi:uncharacterized protein PV07_05229 [Cladophialophora immunda]|uniref:WW domain-containing protein n=1 Tax=Cladophialophora immunda TaxID=569365 RepID=A0A0D2CE48_9EURO|nr:uncharacterized protein PV07_05229 [Cladophialophora immunda]KIW29413.1 hypothetical protein PV07_05229 [Cladophialophora immunda]